MQIIPLQPVPNQAFRAQLGGQDCSITLRTFTTGLYISINVAKSPLLSGIACADRKLIVRGAYLGFMGNLAFVDTQGTEDPAYSGLGTRWQLIYYAPSDL